MAQFYEHPKSAPPTGDRKSKKLERDMGKTPLFNDSADGISMSANVLRETAEKYYNLNPNYKQFFPDSGYYIMERDNKKLIIDSGIICPDYLPAHGHCDALSYELSLDGKPFIVNSGTYEYAKGKWRDFFRSTKAHNTVMIGKTEQSQCWDSFRVAKRIYDVGGNIRRENGLAYFQGSYRNYKRNRHQRWMLFIDDDTLLVIDRVRCKRQTKVYSFIHFHPDYDIIESRDKLLEVRNEHKTVAIVYPIFSEKIRVLFGTADNGWYSPVFGLKIENHVLELQSNSDSPLTGYVVSFRDKLVDIEIIGKKLKLMQTNKTTLLDLAEIGV